MPDIDRVRQLGLTLRLVSPPWVRGLWSRRRRPLDIYHVRTPDEADPLTMSYVDATAVSIFARKYLFQARAEAEHLARARRRRIVRDAGSAGSDLEMVVAEPRLIRRLPRERALSLPSLVEQIVDLGGSWDEVWGRVRKKARAMEKVIPKYGYTLRHSTERSDLERYYHEMYRPTIRERHGEFGSPLAMWHANLLFRRGFLLLVEEAGRGVAGALCFPRRKSLELACVGIDGGSQEHLRRGAGDALYILTMRWAHGRGFRHFNFRNAAPSLRSGIFRYKRKWGSVVRPSLGDGRWMWLRVNRDSPAVRRCLEANPLIIQESNSLKGIILTDTPADGALHRRWRKIYATPGLEDLLVCRTEDFLNRPSPLEAAVPI